MCVAMHMVVERCAWILWQMGEIIRLIEEAYDKMRQCREKGIAV